MSHKMMHISTIILTVLFLSGCLSRDLTFQIRYEQIFGLEKESSIYFQGNVIGQVRKVVYRSQGDYLVEVCIQSEFKNAVTSDSKFYIIADLANQQQKAILVEQQKPGGAIIKKGSIVKGSVKVGIIEDILKDFSQSMESAEKEIRMNLELLKQSLLKASEELNIQLEEALNNVISQLNHLNQEIEKVPDSEEIQKLEEFLKQLSDELKKAAGEVRDQVQKQWIPEVQKQLDKLRERLKEDGREKEIDNVQQRVNEMSEV